MIRLIHWNADEAKECAKRILALGYKVDCSPFTTQSIRELIKQPPEAIVIDLSRLPSQGRDVAATLGQYKFLRTVPFIFVGGETEKVARIRKIFPDLTYGDWPGIATSLKKAIDHAGTCKRVSTSAFEAYKQVPLAKILGITNDQVTRLVSAPDDFETIVGALPPGAVLTRRPVRSPDLTIWFVRSRAELTGMISGAAKAEGHRRLWIAWPKKSIRKTTDVSQTLVRQAGLSNGLVDYKICSINETWSALLFAKRHTGKRLAKEVA